MRFLWVAALVLGFGCKSDGPGDGPSDTGLDVTVEFESTLDVETLSVFGTFSDGTELPALTEVVPVSLDPPGIRQVELAIDVETPGAITVRVDGLDDTMVVIGSGRADAMVTDGERAPVRVILGAPGVCGDGLLSAGVEDCDDGNTVSGDGCSATCTLELGKCGDGRPDPGEACDDGNVIAGDGCSPTCTVEVELPHAYEVEQLTTQTTTAAAWSTIPGTTLTFTPNFGSETWVIFASGTLGSTDPSEIAAELRLVIDGTPVDLVGHQATDGADNEAGFLIFDHLTGDTDEHQIWLEFRAAIGETIADDMRIVALSLPAGADFSYVEQDDVVEATGFPVPILEHEITPASPGEYLVFAKVSHSEAPSVDTVRTRLIDSGGDPHPNDDNGSGFSNGRAPWVPATMIFPVDVTEPRKFQLEGASSAIGTTTDWWNNNYDHRRPLAVVSSGTVAPDNYAVSFTIDHAAMVAAGESRADGRDVRVVFQGAQIDRVLDPDSDWNQADTRIWFSIGNNSMGPNERRLFELYYGRRDPPQDPRADPEAVFLFFDDFEGASIDPLRWQVENMDPIISNSTAEILPGIVMGGFDSFAENTIWEVRSRLSAPVGNRMEWFGAVSPNFNQFINWYSDDGDHHARTGGFVTHFDADSPIAFHVWRFMRYSGFQTRFFQGAQEIAVHDLSTVTIPRGPMHPYIANESQETIFVDWVRVRPWVDLPPVVELGDPASIRGGGPSSWSFAKIMAFRTDVWDHASSATSLPAQSTTATSAQEVVALAGPTPNGATDYVLIQSQRISGANDATGRRSGLLLANGETLLTTQHKITRDNSDRSGYHHVAGVVDLRRAELPESYSNAYASPEGISVRVAESVIILLGYPPDP